MEKEASKTALKKLAANAKKRMKSGYWQNARQERQEVVHMHESLGKDPREAENYLVNKHAIKINAERNIIVKSEEELYQRVCAILDADIDVTNPIAQLIDHDIYDKLEPHERSRYVMVLMFKYSELKERYNHEKLKSLI